MPDQPITKCPLCGFNQVEVRRLTDGRTAYYFKCTRCGAFIATDQLLAGIDNNDIIKTRGYLLSGLCRELYEDGNDDVPELNTGNLETLLNNPVIPRFDDIELKAQKILAWIRKRSHYYGEMINVNHDLNYPVAYASNEEELGALVKLLDNSGLVDIISKSTGGDLLRLTSTGWNLFKRGGGDSKQCFVAIWFDDSMDAATNSICEAIKESGYNPMCIRKEHFSERIMDKAISEIRKSKFMVADLTGDRKSVYFEIGFANGLGIDTIFVYKNSAVGTDASLDFYVKHFQCYGYDNETDLKEILRDAIGARIK